MKVDIETHTNKITILDVNIGDKLVRPKKRGKGTVVDKVTEISDDIVWFGNYGYPNSVIQELNNTKEIELISNDFDVLMQRGKNDKEYFQLVFKHERGIEYRETPFSICYLSDLKVFSDWTEHNIHSLPNPEKVNFKTSGKKITELNI